MPHTETLVKVNAWVDKGIAPLVLALNSVRDVITLDSCEGHDDQAAYVHFSNRRGASQLFAIVHALSTKIGQHLSANDEFRFQIEWVAGSEEPLATLEVRQDFIEPLVEVIRNVAAIALKGDGDIE